MAATPARTFLRQWRKRSGKTLVQVSEELGMTHGQLSRIERGQQPYNQPLLEALAEIYQCDVASLLIRDPSDPDGIWSIWDQAKAGQKRQIVEIAKTIVRTGTDG